MPFSFSTAVEESLREEDDRGTGASTFGVVASIDAEAAKLGVKEAPAPGCLNKPKFLATCQRAPQISRTASCLPYMDFLWGVMLHDMV
jgi:hypothetical protein